MLMMDFAITPELLSLIAELDEFKGRWVFLRNMPSRWLHEQRKRAIAETVSALGMDRTEAAAYRLAADYVFDNYKNISLSENNIQDLSRMLGGEAQPFGPKAVFERHELLRWCQDITARNALHPLLVVGVFSANFLSIHALQGRAKPILSLFVSLLMLQAGYGHVRYSSLDKVIFDNGAEHEKIFRAFQNMCPTGKINWTPWLTHFLKCLKEQKNRLALEIEVEHFKESTKLPQLSLKVLTLLQKNERLTISELIKQTGANQHTVKVHVGNLVAMGRVQLHGKARASWYTLNAE